MRPKIGVIPIPSGKQPQFKAESPKKIFIKFLGEIINTNLTIIYKINIKLFQLLFEMEKMKNYRPENPEKTTKEAPKDKKKLEDRMGGVTTENIFVYLRT